MVKRIEYEQHPRRADICHMGDCQWRVYVSEGQRSDTVWRKSLTSAQSTARNFIQSGKFPR